MAGDSSRAGSSDASGQVGRRTQATVRWRASPWRAVAAQWLALRMESWAKAMARLAHSWERVQETGDQYPTWDASPGSDAPQGSTAGTEAPLGESGDRRLRMGSHPPEHWLEYIRERAPSLYNASIGRTAPARGTQGALYSEARSARAEDALQDAQARAFQGTSKGPEIEPPVLYSLGAPADLPVAQTGGQPGLVREPGSEIRDRPNARPQDANRATTLTLVRHGAEPGVKNSEPQPRDGAGGPAQEVARPTKLQADDRGSWGSSTPGFRRESVNKELSSRSAHPILLRLQGTPNDQLKPQSVPESEARDSTSSHQSLGEPHHGGPSMEVGIMDRPREANMPRVRAERNAATVIPGSPRRLATKDDAPLPQVGPDVQRRQARDNEASPLPSEPGSDFRQTENGRVGPTVKRRAEADAEPKDGWPLPIEASRTPGAPKEWVIASTAFRTHSTWPQGSRASETEDAVDNPWPTLFDADSLDDHWDEEAAAQRSARQVHERRLRLAREQKGILCNE